MFPVLRHLYSPAIFACFILAATAAEIPSGEAGFKAQIKPFFEKHCVECHGPDKNKGKITLHTLDGDLAAGQELEHWETILDVLKFGEMPPEDEPQPPDVERQAIAKWIEGGLRDYVEKAKQETATEPIARRLTNFEYENTMRDLLGIDLDLIDDLPVDPDAPYKFNNTADFMLMGPEQVDRYLQTARRAMASVIVDPEKPEIHTTRSEWKPSGSDTGQANDEVGIWTNRRRSAGQGMTLKGFPQTGEFRIRFQASAILTEGVKEIPLRLVMGYNLQVNSSTLEVEPVGTVNLSNTPDNPQIFEFRGRIENFPVEAGIPDKQGKMRPSNMSITPQNLHNDGTLNDNNRYHHWPRQFEMPRAVINWMEFEGPIVDIWPPAHHTDILFESPYRESHPGDYVREVLDRFISRAYRRPAERGEVAQLEKIYALIKKDADSLEKAMRETLAMVLISPQFLYHTVADGSVVTADHELASRLSYFLWGSMPDDQLLQLAADGKLKDDAVIQQQVLRLLEDGRSADFIKNFTTQWMSLDKLKTIPINSDVFPRFLYYVPAGERAGTEEPYRPTIRDHMVDETVGFIAELIRRNAPASNIVDSDFAYLNEPLAAHYGVEGVKGIDLRPVPIKPEHRLGGLLTHGSVLVGNGTGTAPHPIYRAVWLREAILGDEVKPPPAEVPALTDTVGESPENALSIKDLLALHRTQESCNDCHVRLDPWGIPFERYNAIGQFQPKVPKEGVRVRPFSEKEDIDLVGYRKYLDSINTVEVGAQARVPHGPSVDGMEDLKEFLIEERLNDVAANVLRRLTSYAIGRELSYRDRFEIEEILTDSKINDYPLRDMIIKVCQSKIFTETRDNRNEQ